MFIHRAWPYPLPIPCRKLERMQRNRDEGDRLLETWVAQQMSHKFLVSPCQSLRKRSNVLGFFLVKFIWERILGTFSGTFCAKTGGSLVQSGVFFGIQHQSP